MRGVGLPAHEGRCAVQGLNGLRLGDYILEDELGRGSMGVVYRARHAQDAKPYAVKVLLDALASDQSFITRFTREARIIAGLSHPNIIKVYGSGRQGQHLYFVMEYFPGQTAGHMIKERGRLPIGQAIEIAAQAADALEHAHQHGALVHRDVKPENLLVDRWCRVKVLDFGLARVAGLQGITRIGTVVGSLYYVSPEQLLGQQLDGRSDVYSLGVSLYEMVTGQRPYRGQTLTDMSKAILGATPTPPHEIEPGVPPELERIIGRAMARDLDARYPHAADLCADLRALQAAGMPGGGGGEGARAQAGERSAATGGHLLSARLPDAHGTPRGQKATMRPTTPDAVPLDVRSAGPGRDGV